MARFKIGVLVESFRLPPREGLKKAAELGVDGVQVYAVGGEICPEAMNNKDRAEFRKLCGGLNLEVSALCGDLGGHGFQIASENIHKVERSKKIVDLALDLGTKTVTTHIGAVPKDPDSQAYKTMLAACRELGDYAAAKGAIFAVETGPETAERLAHFLDEVGSRGIGVNMDPANLVMVAGDNPANAVSILGKRIAHTHAKDGVRLQPCDPERIYNAFADGNKEGIAFDKFFREVPLGQGHVNWDEYLAALGKIGFNGYLTIEREVGENPFADVKTAVEFLKNKIR